MHVCLSSQQIRWQGVQKVVSGVHIPSHTHIHTHLYNFILHLTNHQGLTAATEDARLIHIPPLRFTLLLPGCLYL